MIDDLTKQGGQMRTYGLNNEHFAAEYNDAKAKNVVPYFRNKVLDISLIMEFEIVTFWIGFASVELTKKQRKKILKDNPHGGDYVVEYELGENGKLLHCNVLNQHK